ncbi:hypothetical protein SAMN04488028_1011070 [Reichenbachiella agariperforans]|uniref:Uncharacterized protein n=2 Tax=Reichenbachiella agariperforans TaxID=156994 RepID=A0A1M6LRK3_REIAG|nr:hypothetical protein SAMN04488028_1011070 [Reichenbachiella agariperforans]
MARDVGNCIDKNSSFESWLNQGTIEHDNIQIANDYLEGVLSEHNNQIQNDYIYKVAFVDRYKIKHICVDIEDLQLHPSYENQEITYIFEVQSLIHYSLYHLQNWLLFSTEFHQKRWILFMKFLLTKTTGTDGELCRIFWNMLLVRLDLSLKHYADNSQYKTFSEYNEYLERESAEVWDKFIKIRDSKGC